MHRCCGLVDLQVNGLEGTDFSKPDGINSESLEGVCHKQWENGVVRFFPTIVSSPDEVIFDSLNRIARARASSRFVEATIPGVHLEIWVAPEAKGCHNSDYLRNPDFGFLERLGDFACLVKLVTVAPELPGAFDFITRARKWGIKVAMGHTMADYETIQRAFGLGATLSTHLGNGVPSMLPRHGKGNPILPQLLMPNLMASFIADCHHLDPDTIRLFIGTKGVNRTIIVTDSIFAAGLGDGEYEFAGKPIVAQDGRAFLKEDQNVLAGSVTTMLQSFANLLRLGFAPHQIISMMSGNPISFMNLGRMEGCELELDPAENPPKIKKFCIGEGMQVI